ncbi:E3 ubiquitin-protein ligase SINA-like 10 [Miscanthus floridulus]|uniref:E3 ubiquitin-protein ligase SINA-like 10 n=1 Tax=Miscanthus floridulus TaxID=154761 RepID=UPI00345A0914
MESHGRDDDDREEAEQQSGSQDERGSSYYSDDDREEDEQQSGREDERGSSRADESLGGSGADDVVEAGGGVVEQPPAEEGDSDDDNRPIRVVSRAHTLVHRGSTTSTAPAPPAAPAPPESSPPLSDSSSVIRNVTVENSSAFDFSICYLPLKSPIFQCTVGHVVCSPCHDKLGQATSCHVCRIPTPGGYFRCNAMEQVVDSIRVPCPHAAHGCAERLAYHDRDGHARTCAHKPCHCPGEGCGFAGPVQTTLLEHLAAVHGWPCSPRSTTGIRGFYVSFRKGLNIVVVTAGATTITMEKHNTGTVKLGHSYYRRCRRDSDYSTCVQSSQLDVVCTDISNGMPGPSSCFPFLVPRWPAPGGEDDDDIRVTVNYIRGAA